MISNDYFSLIKEWKERYPFIRFKLSKKFNIEIVCNDDLIIVGLEVIRKLTKDELKACFGHEMGHYFQENNLLITVKAITSFITGNVLSHSRQIELDADQYILKLNLDPYYLIKGIYKIHKYNHCSLDFDESSRTHPNFYTRAKSFGYDPEFLIQEYQREDI